MLNKNKTNILLENNDSIFSTIYWRKKYNKLLGEHELLKEVMRDDVYKKTIKTISEPLELARYKKENERLRLQLKVIRDERNDLIKQNREYKKETESHEGSIAARIN